ncbi:MAG TPA: histidine kinase [Nevskiales bacterium]|nr:histidine kinase [Nevskiales bacterium]
MKAPAWKPASPRDVPKVSRLIGLSGLGALVATGGSWWAAGLLGGAPALAAGTLGLLQGGLLLLTLLLDLYLLFVCRRLAALHQSQTAPPQSETAPPDSAGSDRVPAELMQNVLASLLEEPESSEPFVELLKKIESLIGATASIIFLRTEPDGEFEPWAWTSANERDRLSSLVRYSAAELGLGARAAVRLIPYPDEPYLCLIAVRLGEETQPTGLLLLQAPATADTDRQLLPYLETLGRRLSELVYSARRAQLNRRLALYDERATIARELHDSLAQSLSYLKMKVSCLQSLLQQAPSAVEPLDVNSVIEDVRNNLNRAYRQLREIITAFRLTMNGRTLRQALEDSIEEFEKHSSIVFELDNRLSSDRLSVDEEMQVLYIIREALSNIVRHSHGKHARITLSEREDGTVLISVTDDGIGFQSPTSQVRHYGLIIMQERAHSLGGDIRFEAGPSNGTCVKVSFRPKKNLHAPIPPPRRPLDEPVEP